MKKYKNKSNLEKKENVNVKVKKIKNKYIDSFKKLSLNNNLKTNVNNLRIRKNEINTLNNLNNLNNIYINKKQNNTSATKLNGKICKNSQVKIFNSITKNSNFNTINSTSNSNIINSGNFEMKNLIYYNNKDIIDNLKKEVSIDLNKNELSDISVTDKVSNYNFVFKVKNDNESVSNRSRASNISKLQSPFKFPINYYNNNHLDKINTKINDLKSKNILWIKNTTNKFNWLKEDYLNKILTKFTKSFNKVWLSYLKEQKNKIKIKKSQIEPIEKQFLDLIRSRSWHTIIKKYNNSFNDIFFNLKNCNFVNFYNNPIINILYDNQLNLKKQNEILKIKYFKLYSNKLKQINLNEEKFVSLLQSSINQNKKELSYKFPDNYKLINKILIKGKIFLNNKIKYLKYYNKNFKKINKIKNNINKQENKLNSILNINN